MTTKLINNNLKRSLKELKRMETKKSAGKELALKFMENSIKSVNLNLKSFRKAPKSNHKSVNFWKNQFYSRA